MLEWRLKVRSLDAEKENSKSRIMVSNMWYVRQQYVYITYDTCTCLCWALLGMKSWTGSDPQWVRSKKSDFRLDPVMHSSIPVRSRVSEIQLFSFYLGEKKKKKLKWVQISDPKKIHDFSLPFFLFKIDLIFGQPDHQNPDWERPDPFEHAPKQNPWLKKK